MATKDITDKQVAQAYRAKSETQDCLWPYDFLHKWTGQPIKVCYRAMERAHKRGLVDYGTSLRSGWLTRKGVDLIEG